jgi:hypothetical protein
MSFGCDGFVVGFRFSHAVVDGSGAAHIFLPPMQNSSSTVQARWSPPQHPVPLTLDLAATNGTSWWPPPRWHGSGRPPPWRRHGKGVDRFHFPPPRWHGMDLGTANGARWHDAILPFFCFFQSTSRTCGTFTRLRFRCNRRCTPGHLGFLYNMRRTVGDAPIEHLPFDLGRVFRSTFLTKWIYFMCENGSDMLVFLITDYLFYVWKWIRYVSVSYHRLVIRGHACSSKTTSY